MVSSILSINSATNLDTNATYGVLPEVWDGLSKLPHQLLNPSSIHQGGQGTRYLLEEARCDIRDLLGCESGDKVIFTSGATEANNTAIFLPLFRGQKNAHIVTGMAEHPSVLEPAEKLRKLGFEVTFLKPNREGSVSPEEVIAALKPNTALVSLMFANNETGAITPVAEIGEALRRSAYPGYFHVDAVQAVGKVPFSFVELKADFITISGHKFGALAGIGALILREGIEIEPLLYGGPQEKRSRAGTENAIGIHSLSLAARSVKDRMDERPKILNENRAIIWSLLRDELPNIRPTVPLDNTLPNTLNLQIDGVNGADLVVALDIEGVYVSSGAACASGKPGASHVLLSLGLSDEEATQCIRLSVGCDYKDGELESAAKKIVSAVRRIRG